MIKVGMNRLSWLKHKMLYVVVLSVACTSHKMPSEFDHQHDYADATMLTMLMLKFY